MGKEYALYKGDDLLCIGTIKEIANNQNVKEDTIKFYGVKSYIKRIKKRSNKGYNSKILIKC